MGLDVTSLSEVMCTIDPKDSPSYANWGTLVKTWVTGTNQFKGNNQDFSIPKAADALQPVGAMSKDQFRAMLTAAGVAMTIPDKVKRFVFVQDDETTVIVRIPSKKVVDSVQGQLEAMASGGREASYPLPDFYIKNWPPSAGQKSLSQDGLLTMHCQRIGEYTINTCG